MFTLAYYKSSYAVFTLAWRYCCSKMFCVLSKQTIIPVLVKRSSSDSNRYRAWRIRYPLIYIYIYIYINSCGYIWHEDVTVGTSASYSECPGLDGMWDHRRFSRFLRMFGGLTVKSRTFRIRSSNTNSYIFVSDIIIIIIIIIIINYIILLLYYIIILL